MTIHKNMTRLVALLQANNFHTTDSGDGVTNVEAGMEMALDYAHVFIMVPIEKAVAEADRCLKLLQDNGVDFFIRDMYHDETVTEYCELMSRRPSLVMSYEPAQDSTIAVIQLINITDLDLNS